MSYKNSIKILLTGGGTGGSVMPLLVIVEEIGNLEFLWLGTKKGPERQMVEKEGIKFKAIANGKLRRYFSLRNFIDPVFIFFGFVQAFFIILKWKPSLVISAGSFVGVPVVWSAWLLRVPILIHQQDARPGLANKLMAPFARVITVTFEKSLADYGKKAVWTGNPIRYNLKIKNKKQNIKNYYNIKTDLPVVLVIGGGTGALAINQLVEQSLGELIKICQIIHITGKNKNRSNLVSSKETKLLRFYHTFEFLNAEEMANAYAIADMVVSRAGMGVLTELSYLAKPAILIPIPDSHQEDNVKIFKGQNAAIVLDQKQLTAEKLVDKIRKLINNKELQKELSKNIRQVIKRGANEEIVKIIVNILSKE